MFGTEAAGRPPQSNLRTCTREVWNDQKEVGGAYTYMYICVVGDAAIKWDAYMHLRVHQLVLLPCHFNFSVHPPFSMSGSLPTPTRNPSVPLWPPQTSSSPTLPSLSGPASCTLPSRRWIPSVPPRGVTLDPTAEKMPSSLLSWPRGSMGRQNAR